MAIFEKPTKNPKFKEESQVYARPIISSIYTADPASSVGLDGKLYVYPSHDMDPARGCDRMDRYHIYSTEDMVHFTDEGEFLRSDDLPWGRPEGGFMWAPDCKPAKDGKYYYYYPHPSESRWNDTWKFGVCVSDYPNKGFKDIGYIDGIGGWCMIDPSIFIDDDGQNYLYFGGGAMPRACVLEDDMFTIKDKKVYEMEGLEDFHEASYVFKRNGLYYMTYSDNQNGRNRMHYAISDNPLGPWDHKGVYLDPTGCDTSHGSVVEYKGHWYCFYHNCVISGRGPLRSVCVDELFFNEDGTIKLVEQTREDCKSLGGKPWTTDGLPFVAVDKAIHADNKPDFNENGAAVLADGKTLVFTKVDGKQGGRVSMHFAYKTEELAHLRLIVNDTDWSFINLCPDRELCAFTVPMKPGCTNTIRLDFEDEGGVLKGFYLENLD